MNYIYFAISLITSIVGAICGIGGGIIIKPVLDSTGTLDVSTVSFLSGCTVLAMSLYSVLETWKRKDSNMDFKVSTFLGIGAAIGGIAGKYLFEIIKHILTSSDKIGVIQSVILFLITFAALLYTVNKNKILSLHINHRIACVSIGLALGIISSFLGIGGGPLNLAVLYFFFSMEIKAAAQNSLYIILLSQTFSLLFTVISGAVPQFPLLILAGMVLCGVSGAAIGKIIYNRIDQGIVMKLFIGLMTVIMLICLFNVYKFAK